MVIDKRTYDRLLREAAAGDMTSKLVLCDAVEERGDQAEAESLRQALTQGPAEREHENMDVGELREYVDRYGLKVDGVASILQLGQFRCHIWFDGDERVCGYYVLRSRVSTLEVCYFHTEPGYEDDGTAEAMLVRIHLEVRRTKRRKAKDGEREVVLAHAAETNRPYEWWAIKGIRRLS